MSILDTAQRHYLNVTAPDGCSMNWAWQKCRKEFLRTYGAKCDICGNEKDIDVHHIIPRHCDISKTLDHANLMPACGDCHLHICHAGNFHNYVKNIRSIAKHVREKSVIVKG